MILALYKPEIPYNSGAIARLATCISCILYLIEPCFFISDRRFKRARMDYQNTLNIITWHEFINSFNRERMVFLSPHAKTSYIDFQFTSNDIIIGGSESCGFDFNINQYHSVKIEIKGRSLNLAMSMAIVSFEVIRQNIA